jgi:hypothetical protein
MRWTAVTLVPALLLGACRGNPAGPAETRVLLQVHGDSIVYMTPDAARSDDISTAVVDAVTRLPVSGIEIQWQVTTGTATLGAGTARTSEYGVASTWLLRSELGTHQVRASSDRMTGAAPTLQVHVVLRPVISGVEPATIMAGGEVIITGANFSPDAARNTVLFHGLRGRVLSASPTQLRVEVPRCLPSRQVAISAGLGSVHSAPHFTTATGTAGTTLDLAPGTVRTLTTAADFACVRLPGVAGGAYVMVVHNAAELFRPPLPFELRSLMPLPTQAAEPLPTAGRAESFREDWEAALRRRERGYAGGIEAPARAYDAAAAVPAQGSRREFNVFDHNSQFTKVTATARRITPGAIVYVDVEAETSFSDADLEYFGRLFDDPIRPALTTVFGQPTDIDNNQRVIILFTPVVNGLTPRGRSTFVTGFFYGCDLVSRTRCSGTNQAEIIYSMVPDPQARWGDARSVALVRSVVPPVIAHELQHMLHFARRSSTTDALWLYEALAHTAEEIVADVLQARGETALAQLFRSGNHERAKLFLREPTTTSLISEDPPGTVEMRGAAWLFLKYLRGHFGGNDLLRRLTVSQRSGVSNVTYEVGRTWATLMHDFGVALWAEGIPELQRSMDPRYAFPDVSLRTLLAAGAGGYPLRVSSPGWGDFAVGGALGTGGHAYFAVSTSAPAPPPLHVVLSGVRGAPLDGASAAAVSIIRVR